MTGLGHYPNAVRELGVSSTLRFGLYQIGLRTGWYQHRTPIFRWEDRPFSSWVRPNVPQEPGEYVRWRGEGPAFFFRPGEFPQWIGGNRLKDSHQAIEMAEAIAAGQFHIFGQFIHLGNPPDWAAPAPLATDLQGVRFDNQLHWTAYASRLAPVDIKYLWEPARFGWIYPLVRAYARNGDPRWFDICWTLIDSWRQAVQPNAGPHWSSAQEVALRLLALAFGLYGFQPELDKHPEITAAWVQTIAVLAHRIPITLNYARAQRNNHLLSEAAGLYTVGLLFPELRFADSWRALGYRHLRNGFEDQIFSDGGYIQHSTNYHRLALQIGLWVAHLAEINGEPLPARTLEGLWRMTQCLAALVEPSNGQVPNFGPNDGADAFPLCSCSFTDYRPVIQSAWRFFTGKPHYPAGPWDEASSWLGLIDDQERSLPADGSERGGEGAGLPGKVGRSVEVVGKETLRKADYPQAGLYLLGGERNRAVVRCAQFSSRPGHSDQLHLNLWRCGHPVTLDPGTYRYQAPEPWNNALSSALVHNGPITDSLESMARAGRFLWLRWAHGNVSGRWRSPYSQLEAVTANHDGYQRIGVTVQRTVVRAKDTEWLVVDEWIGDGEHIGRVGWLFAEGQWELVEQKLFDKFGKVKVSVRWESAIGRCGLYRAGKHVSGSFLEGSLPIWGWYSPTYATKLPRDHWVIELEGRLPLRLITRFSLEDRENLDMKVEWRSALVGQSPFTSVAISGDRLDL